MDSLQDLLRDVSRIVYQDKQEREEHRKRGEYFNVFRILNLESNETRTHSAFIAELLNPKGSHGVGDTFLKAFLSILELDNFDFDAVFADVQVEYHIGFKNEENTDGGRIDILVASRNKAILIENKIYAGDQENQLIRYYNFGKEKYTNNFKLLYLTLDGHDASEYSKENKYTRLKPNQDYYLVGYNQKILSWLERCIELAARYPLVRETVRQYKSLVEHLVGKNMNEKNNKELVSLLTNSENVEITLAILSVYNDIVSLIKKKFVTQLRVWVEDKGWLYNYDDAIWKNGIGGDAWIYIYKEEYCPWAICLGHDSPGGKWYYGISNRAGERPVKMKAFKYFLGKPNDTWPFGFQWFNQYCDWNSIDSLRDMNNGKMLKVMQDIIDPIIQDIESGVIDLKQ